MIKMAKLINLFVVLLLLISYVELKDINAGKSPSFSNISQYFWCFVILHSFFYYYLFYWNESEKNCVNVSLIIAYFHNKSFGTANEKVINIAQNMRGSDKIPENIITKYKIIPMQNKLNINNIRL